MSQPPKEYKGPPARWRDSADLLAIRAELMKAFGIWQAGASIHVNRRTARALVDVLDQAIHTEQGHGA